MCAHNAVSLSVHKRAEYVRYIFNHTESYPDNFDKFICPVAVFDRGGTIRGANRSFREITGITGDDIRFKKINIYDYLNDKNAGLAEAAHSAFESGGKTVYTDTGPILRIKEYNNLDAVFFPMNYDRDKVKLVAVLLCKKRNETNINDDIRAENEYTEAVKLKKKPTPISASKAFAAAAVCVAAVIIGVGVFNIIYDYAPDKIQDEQIALGEPEVTREVPEKSVTIPDIGDVVVAAGEVEVEMFLFNPAENIYGFIFEIVLVENDEIIYVSELVEPGKYIESVTLLKELTNGDHNAVLIINSYTSDVELKEPAGIIKLEFKFIVN